MNGSTPCDESPPGDSSAIAQATFEQVVYQELDVPFEYRSVAVLLVHWADYLDQDLKGGNEVRAASSCTVRLANVPQFREVKELFEQRFHFECETLTLDDKEDPQLQLSCGIPQFIRRYNGDCRTHLLILYYSGHGDHHSDEEGLYIRG